MRRITHARPHQVVYRDRHGIQTRPSTLMFGQARRHAIRPEPQADTGRTHEPAAASSDEQRRPAPYDEQELTELTYPSGANRHEECGASASSRRGGTTSPARRPLSVRASAGIARGLTQVPARPRASTAEADTQGIALDEGLRRLEATQVAASASTTRANVARPCRLHPRREPNGMPRLSASGLLAERPRGATSVEATTRAQDGPRSPRSARDAPS